MRNDMTFGTRQKRAGHTKAEVDEEADLPATPVMTRSKRICVN